MRAAEELGLADLVLEQLLELAPLQLPQPAAAPLRLPLPVKRSPCPQQRWVSTLFGLAWGLGICGAGPIWVTTASHSSQRGQDPPDAASAWGEPGTASAASASTASHRPAGGEGSGGRRGRGQRAGARGGGGGGGLGGGMGGSGAAGGRVVSRSDVPTSARVPA